MQRWGQGGVGRSSPTYGVRETKRMRRGKEEEKGKRRKERGKRRDGGTVREGVLWRCLRRQHERWGQIRRRTQARTPVVNRLLRKGGRPGWLLGCGCSRLPQRRCFFSAVFSNPPSIALGLVPCSRDVFLAHLQASNSHQSACSHRPPAVHVRSILLLQLAALCLLSRNVYTPEIKAASLKHRADQACRLPCSPLPFVFFF